MLHLIAERKKVIIIDCAYMNKTPGTMIRFSPDDVESVKKLMHYSLHEIDILKVIELARRLNQCPEDIVILGVEPEKIELKDGLNPALVKNIDGYLETVRSLLQPESVD